MNHRRPTSPAITELAALFSCVPFRRQRIGGRIQETGVCVGIDRQAEPVEARIDCVQFLDDGLEIGKVLNALALEVLFLLHGSDDLAYELCQPGHRVGLVNGEGVRRGRQEVAAITKHERLQMEFDGVAIHEDHWGNVEVGKRTGVQLERRQRLRSLVKGPGVKEEVFRRDVVAVHDGIVWS
jgi:hypothetical protein